MDIQLSKQPGSAPKVLARAVGTEHWQDISHNLCFFQEEGVQTLDGKGDYATYEFKLRIPGPVMEYQQPSAEWPEGCWVPITGETPMSHDEVPAPTENYKTPISDSVAKALLEFIGQAVEPTQLTDELGLYCQDYLLPAWSYPKNATLGQRRKLKQACEASGIHLVWHKPHPGPPQTPTPPAPPVRPKLKNPLWWPF